MQKIGNMWSYLCVIVPVRKILPFIAFVLLLASCRKERFFDGQTTLKLAADTIWFDTVFTRQAGSTYPISVTQITWIKNPESQTVKASFRLGGGMQSAYRINVDGIPGPVINEVEIPAKDSVFVFVQCSLEANGQTGPALVLDSLMMQVNGREQKLILGAYGWDAHYFRAASLPCGGSWNDQTKPYVIVDNALIPAGCTFTIKEGVKVYCSARSALFVAGKLFVEGTSQNRVLFTGDKPVSAARTLPNQWVGLYFAVGSAGNSIKYADIQNASIGIRVDSLPVGSPDNLVLENTKIQYCGQACMAGITAHIRATNCLFAQTGSYSFLGLLGGKYDFRHCTFASYVNYTTRQDGHFAITNTLRDGNGNILDTRPLECNTYNSVIYGDLDEELLIDKGGSAAFTADFLGNLIKSKSKPFAGITNLYNRDPRFRNIMEGNFAPDTLSPLHNAGILLTPPVTTDLEGKPRIGVPDIGAFERPE